MAARACANLFLFAKPKVEVKHFLDWVGGMQGIKDLEWVAQAKSEGWFVVTGDRGQTKDGAPLHILLPAYGVSAAFLTGSLQSDNGFAKLAGIVALWPQIEAAATKSTPGSRFKIRRTANGYSLVEWPLNDAGKKAKARVIQDIPPHLFAGTKEK